MKQNVIGQNEYHGVESTQTDENVCDTLFCTNDLPASPSCHLPRVGSP